MSASLKPILRWLAPLLPGLLIGATCLAVKENYPFSHFPMYKGFATETFYVYVADASGEPVAIQSITYFRTSRIKKIYDGELREISRGQDKRKSEVTPDERAACAQHTLRWLYENTRPDGQRQLDALGGIQLYHVDIVMRDGQAAEEPPIFAGEIRLPLEGGGE